MKHDTLGNMKVMICGSMTFAKEMVDMKGKLEALGHAALVPLDVNSHVKNSKLVDDLDSNLKHAIEKNIMKRCFDLVAESDAILVLNYLKNGIKGYVGTSTLMEIGLAYYLGKKIFLLNTIPKSKEARWVHELEVMQPIIINGDLKKIAQDKKYRAT